MISTTINDLKKNYQEKISKKIQNLLGGVHGQYSDYTRGRAQEVNRQKDSTTECQSRNDVLTAVSSTTQIRKSSTSKKKITNAYMSKEDWETLSGDEFYTYENVDQFSQTGVALCDKATHPNLIWKPDKQTEEILRKHGENGSESLTYALQNILPPDTVLVWKGKFDKSTNAHGGDLPIIRTRGIVSGMSPKQMATLLLNSSQVTTYNKMSLGRKDILVFQKGIDSIDESFGDGETKIAINLTKPPLVNKKLEFQTMMHARKLRPNECCPDDGGYIMVSRAVPDSADLNNGSSDNNDVSDRNTSNKGKDDTLRSEILMGANLFRVIPGKPESTDLTSVTHLYSPLVHPLVAGKVGMKGAIDFHKDMRSIGQSP